MDLSIELSGIKLINPVIAASGTFGYGEEFERFADLRRIGGICVKGTSARPIEGNLPPRLFPTASGMLNSIGLENVGVDAFIRDKMPFLQNAGCAVFVNVFGFTFTQCDGYYRAGAGGGRGRSGCNHGRKHVSRNGDRHRYIQTEDSHDHGRPLRSRYPANHLADGLPVCLRC